MATVTAAPQFLGAPVPFGAVNPLAARQGIISLEERQVAGLANREELLVREREAQRLRQLEAQRLGGIGGIGGFGGAGLGGGRIF